MHMTEQVRSKLNNGITNFLILECLAVLGFGLGGINVVFYALAIVISLFAIFVAWNKFSKEERKTLLIYSICVFAFSAFYSFGALYITSNVAENLLIMLAINAALFLGIASRKIKCIKPEVVLAVIGSSIALLVLISMIATWTQYGLFYRQIYSSTPVYYYAGKLHSLVNETMFLRGFTFVEALPQAYCLFGIICTCFLGGCLFIKPKEKPAIFWIYFGVGIIGFLSIFTLLYVRAVLFLIPIVLTVFLYKYLRKNPLFCKILKISLIVIAAIFVLFFVFVVINSIGNNAFSNFVASNAFLNKIFNANGIVAGVNKIINYLFNNGGLFGIKLEGNVWQVEEIFKVVYTNTGMFEIEVLKESGVFAFLILLVFIVLEAIMLGKYAKKSNDSDGTKIIFLSIIIGVFLYSSFSSTILPYTNLQTDYQGILRGPIPLLILFMVGYTLVGSNKETILETQNVKEIGKNKEVEEMVL